MHKRISRAEVWFPYVNCNIGKNVPKLSIDSSISSLTDLLLYIGESDTPIYESEDTRINHAISRIYFKLNPYRYRVFKRKISKKQIKRLILTYGTADAKYVKIPYLIDEIFSAIFSLVEEKKSSGKPMPKNLKSLVGNLRRDCFYAGQALAYDTYINDPNSQSTVTDLRRKLNNDINSQVGDCCTLGELFK